MGEFFRGWRRKVGVVTLLIACLFAAGWVRSQHIVDCIFVGHPGRVHHLSSDAFGIWSAYTCYRQTHQGVTTRLLPEFSYRSFKEPLRPISPDFEFSTDHYTVRTFCGFYFAVATQNDDSIIEEESTWIIPYWSIVIPLTLLSAFLLLSKPCKSTSKKIIELNVIEGA